MPEKQKWYNLPAAKALRDYVESNFKMLTTDKKLYEALQILESQQDGICKDVVATHRTMARVARIDRDTIKASLIRMKDEGIISYTPGSRNYADRKASRICRISRDELKSTKLKRQPAYKLAKLLNKRPIAYSDRIIQPTYNVGITNRLYASDPNVQAHKEVRGERLAVGCTESEILIELDFKAAEPSVIAQKLGYDIDGYSIIAQAEDWHVDDVKRMFNPIVYTRSRSTITAAENYGITAPKALEFLARVDVLREQLRRPNGNPVRHTTTVSGTKIDALPGKKIHNGTLLSYYAQGTIADFMNKAALEIIALEKKRGWRLVIPCHDAVYVIAKAEQEEELRSLILKQAGQALKLKLQTTTKRNPNPREGEKSGTRPHKPSAT